MNPSRPWPLRGLLLYTLLMAESPALLSPANAAEAARVIPWDALARAPLRVTVQGQTFSRTLDQIVAAVTTHQPVSVWLDRRVDPDQSVDLVSPGPTAAAVLMELVRSHSLAAAVIPVAEDSKTLVVLVGRPGWVDNVLATFDAFPIPSPTLVPPTDVRWPDGTTPASILRAIVDAPPGGTIDLAGFTTTDDNASTWVPHDLWRAGQLSGVDAWTAAQLVLCQLDLCRLATREGPAVQPSLAISSMRRPGLLRPLDNGSDAKPIVFSYMIDGDRDAANWRTRLRAIDATAKVRGRGGLLDILATPTVHRQLVADVWQHDVVPPARNAGRSTVTTEATFELKLVNKPAGEVIRHLATTAGLKFELLVGAELRADRLISLDAKSQTLPELARRVAAMAELNLDWGESSVKVGLPK